MPSTATILKRLGFTPEEISNSNLRQYTESCMQTFIILHDLAIKKETLKKFLQFGNAANIPFDTYLKGNEHRQYSPEDQNMFIEDLEILGEHLFNTTKLTPFPSYAVITGSPNTEQDAYVRNKYGLELNGTLESLGKEPGRFIISQEYFTIPNMFFYKEIAKEKGIAQAKIEVNAAARWITEVLRAIAVIHNRHIIEIEENQQDNKLIYTAIKQQLYVPQFVLLFGMQMDADNINVPQTSAFYARMLDTYFQPDAAVSLHWVEREGTELLFTKCAESGISEQTLQLVPGTDNYLRGIKAQIKRNAEHILPAYQVAEINKLLGTFPSISPRPTPPNTPITILLRDTSTDSLKNDFTLLDANYDGSGVGKGTPPTANTYTSTLSTSTQQSQNPKNTFQLS